MEWMFLPLKRYAQFSGRARRKEFWMWVLFIVIASVVLSILDRMLGLAPAAPAGVPGQSGPAGAAGVGTFRGGLLTTVFSLGVLVPNLAVQVRRLHDGNRSGWWMLLPIVPYVIGFAIIIAGMASTLRSGQPVQQGALAMVGAGGIFFVIGLICAILLFVWFCLDGTRGPNRFGEDPKRQDLGEVFS